MKPDRLYNEIFAELENILDYWELLSVDSKNNGFVGLIDFYNLPDFNADKGIILNTRILWTFSAAYKFYKRDKLKEIAESAFNYIKNNFFDILYGGFYWNLDYKGNPVNKRKQIYAQAFAMYALTEYYQISNDNSVLKDAQDIFKLIEKFSYDPIDKGYIEAFGEDWSSLDDFRLSEKDENAIKTMNTHLHILEAYTNLYKIWRDDKLRQKLIGLIRIFTDHIVNKKTFHLDLFFNEKWEVQSKKISYGHDIETSWLLFEAAEILNDSGLKKEIAGLSLKIAEASIEGVDIDGGLMNEFNQDTHHLDTDKHWWPQAEALIGFLNAYELSGDRRFLEIFDNSWKFINQYIIDHKNGEWFWRVDRNGLPYKEVKAGFWKCPYHNSRACIEVLTRMKRLELIKSIN